MCLDGQRWDSEACSKTKQKEFLDPEKKKKRESESKERKEKKAKAKADIYGNDYITSLMSRAHGKLEVISSTLAHV